MSNKCFAAVAGTAALLAGFAATTTQAQQPINVTVDGGVVSFTGQQPIEQFGSVLVPLRGVFEKLGATVAYDGGTRSILAVRGPTTVTLKLGSRDATVNNTPRTLAVPAQAINGSTLVPLRFVSEALGAQVQWQQESRTVIVSTNGSSTSPAPPAPTNSGRRPLPADYFRYSRIDVRWDFNNLNVRDRADLEARIRRELNTDAGSPLVSRRPTSKGTLTVAVTLRRADPDSVQAEVRLGLSPVGVTGTDNALTPSRNNTVDGQVVLQALRKARRQFRDQVEENARNMRRGGE